MFGLEILDVVIGLTFVFLLLSLLATAINEYLTAVMNLRGKELARGLGRLLDDVDERAAVKHAQNGISANETGETASLTERLYDHPLVRPLATRRGVLVSLPGRVARGVGGLPGAIRRVRDRFSGRPRTDVEPNRRGGARLPSYIPARTFAMALLDIVRVRDKPAVGIDKSAGFDANLTDADAVERLKKVLGILKREAPLDVNQHLGDLTAFLNNANLQPEVKLRLIDTLSGAQSELDKLHDSVEVWFNHSMDRVSGAYKRTVQGWLFVIGLLIASCSNADTVDMWRRLSANDKVREGMAARAIASVGVLDSVVRPPTRTDTTTLVQSDTATRRQPPVPTPPVDTSGPRTALDSARLNYRTARARLDSLELKLGWTRENLQAIGVVDSIRARRDSLERVRRDSSGTAGEDRRIRLALARLRPRVDSANEQEKQILRDSISGLMEDSIADAAAAATARQRHWRDGLSRASLAAPVKHPVPFWTKVFGLLLTAIAISLGAPFWFDLLNKVISIRAAGRSPSEKPKSPEGDPKRLAEHTPM